MEDLQIIAGGHSGADLHSQCLAGVFVEHSEHLVATAVAQLVVH